MKQKPNSVYDGFCHRPFNEEYDGWMLEQPEINEYPAVLIAKDILAMYNEIKALRKEVWHLRKNEKLLDNIISKEGK